MRSAAVGIVLLGLAVTTGLALSGGLDLTGGIILALIFVMGALAVAVARRSTSGAVQPARCDSCDGLVSPNAPYCKHCGASLR